MNKKLTGIYRAIVTDNSCFKTTGKIKTKISCFNNNHVEYDLVNGYSSEEYQKQVNQDRLTLIFMPFGGGYNYGMFKLPEVNSIGLVQFIDGNPKAPIWLGSYCPSVNDISGSLIENSIPSDSLENNNSAFYTETNANSFSFNMEDEKSFIIKTKETSIDDLSDPSTMNWKESDVNNTFILNKEKALLNHNVNEDEDYYLKINNDEISINYSGDDNSKSIKVTDDSISVSSAAGNLSFSAKLSGNTLTINTSDSSGIKTIDSTISQTPSKLTLKAGDSSIIAKRTSTGGDEISVTAPIIRLSADNIIMGNTGYSLVACPNKNMAITLEDGTMLSSLSSIEV